MNIETVYAVLHQTRKSAYIGKTCLTIGERFAQHLRSAAAGEDKPLFEELRHAPQEWDIIECETSDTASEQHWIAQFKNDDYTLLNVAAGNTKPAKARDTAKEKAAQEALRGARLRWEQPKLDEAAAALAREAEQERVKAHVAQFIADNGGSEPLTYAQQVLATIRAGKKWVP